MSYLVFAVRGPDALIERALTSEWVISAVRICSFFFSFKLHFCQQMSTIYKVQVLARRQFPCITFKIHILKGKNRKGGKEAIFHFISSCKNEYWIKRKEEPWSGLIGYCLFRTALLTWNKPTESRDSEIHSGFWNKSLWTSYKSQDAIFL